MITPTDIRLQQKSRKLVIAFNSGETFDLPFEYLRVYSQSAEVTGHAPGDEVLQVGKRNVLIENITPVGNYAIKLHFDDGHDTGLYSWERLYDLGKHYDTYWQAYLQKLLIAGHRHPDHQTNVSDLLS